MSLTSVQVLAGPGMVARFGDVLLWLEEGAGGGQGVTSRLLELVRELSEGADPRPVGGQLAEVLRRDPLAVPALVLVAPSGDGLQVVVHGWGRVLADGVDIDGGWVDRHLAWTTALAAGRGGDLLRVPSPGSVHDLRRGSTPGGGAAVALAARSGAPPPSTPAPVAPEPGPPAVAPEPAPAPVAEPDPAPTFQLVDLQSPPPRRQSLPLAGAEAPVGGVTVKGVLCSRGHFNNPVALSCGTCGIGMGQVTRILQDGPRPSLGALVLDDGTAYGLDADHLLGSDPQEDPAVAQGARPVTVADSQVAPAHAEVRLVGWDVVLVARATAFVLAPGGQQWVAAPLGQATPLAAGTRVAVGQRTFVVEST